MIQGTVEKLKINPFITKAGKDMFKVELLVNGEWFTTISKYSDSKITTGDTVFFEVQDQYPTSIELGTLKKSANGTTYTSGTTTKKDTFTITEKEWKETQKRLAALEEVVYPNDELKF